MLIHNLSAHNNALSQGEFCITGYWHVGVWINKTTNIEYRTSNFEVLCSMFERPYFRLFGYNGCGYAAVYEGYGSIHADRMRAHTRHGNRSDVMQRSLRLKGEMNEKYNYKTRRLQIGRFL
jgi:hypothetical protein